MRIKLKCVCARQCVNQIFCPGTPAYRSLIVKQNMARKFWVSHNFVPTFWHLIATTATLEMDLGFLFFFPINTQNLKQSSNPAGLPKSVTSLLTGNQFSSVHVPLLPRGLYPLVTVPAGSVASHAYPVFWVFQYGFLGNVNSNPQNQAVDYILQSGELRSDFCTNKFTKNWFWNHRQSLSYTY